jgi:hypothetical protein
MFKREEAMLLKLTSKRLGFNSISSYVMSLHAVRLKMAWDKSDLECLSKYGKLPTVEVGTATSEKEVMEKLGLKNAKKIGESEQNETLTVEKMPKTSEFFKETK